MLPEIKAELSRLNTKSVQVSLDADFEPKAGELVKVELGSAYWHLPQADLLQLLKDLPDGAGSEAVKAAIEKQAPQVWHGPAPRGSRDAAP